MLLLFFSIVLTMAVLLIGCHRKGLPPYYTDLMESRRNQSAKDAQLAEMAKQTKEEKEKEEASLEKVDDRVTTMLADAVSEQSRTSKPGKRASLERDSMDHAKLQTITDTARISDLMTISQIAKSPEKMPLEKTQMPSTDANKVSRQLTSSTSISCNKNQLSFPSSSGGQETVKLTNRSQKHIVIKSRCSDNNIFTVEPVFSKVDPGQTVPISVHRKAAPQKQDKIVFEWLPVMENEKNLTIVFKKAETVENRIELPVISK